MERRGWRVIRFRVWDERRRVILVRSRDGRGNTTRLTPRELQVASQLASGSGAKHVADELQLSYTSVRAITSRVLHKLGLQSSSQLPLLWHCLHASPRLFVCDAADILVFESKLAPLEGAGLTKAEHSVLFAVLAGRKNAEIATLRGASPRTVANQLAALFQKLEVSSRAELVAAYLRLTREAIASLPAAAHREKA